MSKRKTGKKSIRLTERALRDIVDIEQFSIDNWGKRVARRYVSDIESALSRLADHPELLRSQEQFHANLTFYRANQHLLVCDSIANKIYVLTVLNASTDIPERLAELEPTMAIEAELLHKQLSRSKK